VALTESEETKQQQLTEINRLKALNEAKDKHIHELKEKYSAKEKMVTDLQAKLREEREQMQQVLESNAERRTVYEVEARCKIL
jgi:hypothetical protein